MVCGGAATIPPIRPPLPDGPAAIDADWMRQALAAGGASGGPPPGDVVVEDLGAATNAFGRLLRCHLTTGGGAAADPATVIVKLPTADRRVFRFATWMGMHERECLFYRRLARHAPVRSPALLYADFDEGTHRFVLVLEDLGHLEVPVQVAGVPAGRARRAVREIARLHGRFWNAVDDPALAGCWDIYGPRIRRIMQMGYLLRLPVVLERFGDCLSPPTRRLAEALGPRITAHLASLAAGPRTLVHGDYRAENLFFGPSAEGDFAVADWQGCGLGPGLYDVAYFLATNVAPGERRRIEREAVEEYHDAVCRLGAAGFTVDDCWRGYRQSMLGVLVACILGCGALDLGYQRLHALVRSALQRAAAAAEDLDAAEFLPRGRFLSAANAFSLVSRGAHRALRYAGRRRAAAND